MSSDASAPAPAHPSQPSDNSDSSTHLDLNKVFAHPAGLRTARFFARSLIARASQTPDGRPTNGIFSSVSLPFVDSSPEVESLLREILAFSESETMVSGSEDPGTASTSPDGNKDVMFEAASAIMSMSAERSRSQHSFTNAPFASNSSSTNVSTNLYSSHRPSPSFTPHNTQQPLANSLPNMEAISGFRPLGSPLHGTESPYNVESPSGRSTTITPHNMSQQSSGRPANVANLANPEMDPLRLDRTSPFSSHLVSSQAPTNTQPKLASGGYLAQSQSQTPTPQIQPYNLSPAGLQSRLPANPSPHIKNFLPVNKAPSNDNMAGKKDSLSYGRTIAVINRVAPGLLPQYNHISSASQQPHSHTLISPHPGVNHSSFKNQSDNMTITPGNLKRRKPRVDGAPRVKRSKTDKPAGKTKKVSKEKEEKPVPACQKISGDLWLRIIEFCPPSFLKKVRLLNRSFKELIDKYDSVYVNQRMENFGADIPVATMMGLTERQYTDLLGGKGCLEPGCSDKKASRTHWSWAKRWCTECWRSKIEREDRILKARQHDFPNRLVLTKLLECIPIGMHDSFMKAHDYIENLESRPSTAPRIYKYYLKDEVDKIIDEYQSFKPPPFKDDPTKSTAENATARADHQQLEAEAVVKQSNFLDERKEKNTEHMQRVLKIEGAIRTKRQGDAQPYNENRKARRELFIKRAAEDIPDIPESFIVETKAFKAATRIFRDPGTERGWKTLQPKIQKEWDDSTERRQAETSEADVIEIDGDDEDNANDQQLENGARQENFQMQHIQPQTSQPNQMAAFSHRRIDHQSEVRQFMNERANNMIASGGMFGSAYGSNFGGSSINNTGTTLQGLQSMYSTAPLENSAFFNGPALFQAQLHSQLSNLNHSQSQMSLGFSPSLQSSYMSPQLSNNNHINMFGSASAMAHSGDRKITVSSLLAPGPAPGSAHHFDGFQ